MSWSRVFFFLSKTLDVVVSPLFWGLALVLACAAATRWGSPRLVRGLAGGAFLALYLPATTLVGRPLFAYLESFDAPRIRADVTYDAVILLGGFIGRFDNGEIELSEGGERVLRTWELLRTNRARYAIIAAGGAPGLEPEAEVAADLLVQMGVDRRRLLLDRQSRNTQQNAVETRAIVEREGFRRLVLVTSAFHVQRAVGCMRAVGLGVDVWATDHQSPFASSWFEAMLPRASHLAASERALRELLGRLVYRVGGYAR